VKSARHWEKAFYGDQTLKALGLPNDHNDRLAQQRTKGEEELQQKEKPGPTAPKQIAPI
jgi:hypothetical protein